MKKKTEQSPSSSFEYSPKLYNMVGNKEKMLHIIVPKIVDRILQTDGRGSCDYVEPFCGSGVVFTNVLKMLLCRADSKKKLNIRFRIYDDNEFIIDFWNVLMKWDDVKIMLDNIKRIIKPYTRAKNKEAQKREYLLIRDRFNSTEIRCAKPVMRAAYFIVLMKLCYGSIPRFNKSGQLNIPPGYRNVKTLSDIIDVQNLLEIQKMLTDKKLHEKAGMKMKIEFTHMDIRNSVINFIPKNKGINCVCYMDPPYDDSFDMYGGIYENITSEVQWAIMMLLERSKKTGMKTPTVMVSNCRLFSNRYCKYKIIIKIKDKHDIHKKPREEVLVSNKSLGEGGDIVIRITRDKTDIENSKSKQKDEERRRKYMI